MNTTTVSNTQGTLQTLTYTPSVKPNFKFYACIVIPIIFIFILGLILSFLYRRSMNRNASRTSQLHHAISSQAKVISEFTGTMYSSSITTGTVIFVARPEEDMDPKIYAPWANFTITRVNCKSNEVDLEKGIDEHSLWERPIGAISNIFDCIECGIVSTFVTICTRVHNLRQWMVDRFRTLGLFIASFFGRSATSGMTRSDTFVWDMRPSPSMTMPGPRKMIEPRFVYVPYITVVTPEGDVGEECGRWYHDMITASEAEELQLSKMDCEQAKKVINVYFEEKMAKKKAEKKAKKAKKAKKTGAKDEDMA